MKITQYCWIACDRVNKPVKAVIFDDSMPVYDALVQGWPDHAPFEFKQWWPFGESKNGCWISELGHNFIVS